MYIIFLDSRKKLRKYMESLSKSEIKNIHVAIASDDVDDSVIPKKAEISDLRILLPPPQVTSKFVLDENTAEFQESYYRYLSRPLCKACLNKIAKLCFIHEQNVVVATGDIDRNFNISKCIQKAFEADFPDIKFFTFKDWKENPDRVINYRQDDVDGIIKHIITDANGLSIKLKELNSLENRFDDYYGE